MTFELHSRDCQWHSGRGQTLSLGQPRPWPMLLRNSPLACTLAAAVPVQWTAWHVPVTGRLVPVRVRLRLRVGQPARGRSLPVTSHKSPWQLQSLSSTGSSRPEGGLAGSALSEPPWPWPRLTVTVTGPGTGRFSACPSVGLFSINSNYSQLFTIIPIQVIPITSIPSLQLSSGTLGPCY